MNSRLFMLKPLKSGINNVIMYIHGSLLNIEQQV